MKKDLDWGTIFKYGIILFIITVVCTLLLALTNMITSPVIAERDEQANVSAQQSVLPDADKFEEVADLDKIKSETDNGEIIDSVDEAYKGNDLVGYTVKTLPSGYGGEIEMLTGINTEGEITGIYILNQSETAGLGARSTEEDFQKQFQGLDANEAVQVEKNGPPEGNEIQAISGATITSTAVTDGVNTSEEAVKTVEDTK